MDGTVAPQAAGAKAGDDRPGRVDPAMTSSDVWMSTFLRSRTARAWLEEQLTLREQAIIALTTDISLGVRGEPFRRHVELLLECGASAEEVRDVVRFVAELGLSRAAAAMAELEPVLRAHEARLGDG
jgi:alkylhydroperoxidase/carboxymuconolactone decarboxylase family protein YurZ